MYGLARPRSTNVFWKDIDFRPLLFIWSVQVLSKRTADILQQDLGTSAGDLEASGNARLGTTGIVKAVDDLAGGRQ
jgi:hypothetical protein